MKRTLLALLLALGTAPARANEVPCNKVGLTAFGMSADGTLTDDQACLIFKDLVWVKSLRLSSNGDMLKKFYGVDDPDAAGEKLIGWLKARVTKVGKRGVANAYAANLGHATRAKAINEQHPYGSVVFTDEFFKLSSRIERVAVYFHEARHSDGDKAMAENKVDPEKNPDTSHGFCRTVSTKPLPPGTLGDDGCDPKFNGCYAYQAVLMKNISEACVQCDAAEKETAKKNAQSAFINHHNEVPDYTTPR